MKKIDYLVVEYTASSTWPRNITYSYAITCKDGKIPDSFSCEDGKRNLKTILNEISNEQQDTNRRILFSEDAYKMAQVLRKEGKFLESKELIAGKFKGEDMAKYDTDNTQAIVPYWWKQDGGPEQPYQCWDDSNWETGEVLDSRCKVLILPTHIPKQKSDHVKDIALSIIETPFALVIDVAMSPIEILAHV